MTKVFFFLPLLLIASKLKVSSHRVSTQFLFFFSRYPVFLSLPFNDHDKLNILVKTNDHRSKKTDFSRELSRKPERGVGFSGCIVNFLPAWLQACKVQGLQNFASVGYDIARCKPCIWVIFYIKLNILTCTVVTILLCVFGEPFLA